MNKYLRAAVCVPCGFMKMFCLKIFHNKSFSGTWQCLVSPFTEITVENGGELRIGNRFKMRDGAKIRVRKGGKCIIGNNTSVNSWNMIVCHDSIVIGDGCQLAPGVQIYDHDHDFRAEGGIGEMKFNTAAVKIGSNVWVGANTIILRGTIIGDNCVIGAGSVIKGKYEAGTVVIQKRVEDVRGGI